MAQDNFVPHSTELYGVTNFKFEAFILLHAVVFVFGHQFHHEPKLVAWI